MKAERERSGKTNVLLLGIVSFLNDLSSEMIMPILPMFITALGGGGLVVGLVGGVRESVSSILKVLCGYWSDKSGRRKPFVVWGYVSSAVFKFLLAFSRVWSHVLIFSGLERVGKGMRTAPRDAIIAESMPAERGKGFGIHRAMDTAGAIAGSLLVFLLFWFWGMGFKTIILIAAAIALSSLLPLHFVSSRRREPQEMTFKISLQGLPTGLRSFILVSGVFALANFSYMFFILRAQTAFSGKAAIGIPIFLYVIFNVAYTLLAIPFGILSDRIGRRKVLIMGYLLFALTSLGFSLFRSTVAFLVLFVLYGMVYAMVEGNQRAFVSDLSPEGLKATALGTFHTVVGIAALPGSLIAGLLWQRVSPSATFLYGAVLAFLSVLLFASLWGSLERRG